MFRKEALDRLSTTEELDELMHVTTPRSWLALLALGSLLVVALVWGLFTTIPITVTGRGALTAPEANASNLEATVYVSLEDGPQIQPGMPVKIALSGAQKEQWGLLLGTVASVDEFPADQEAMLNMLGIDTYVQTLVTAGQLIPVQVQLTPDTSNPSGYRWSSGQGPSIELRRGMVLDATITMHEQRAIDLVLQ